MGKGTSTPKYLWSPIPVHKSRAFTDGNVSTSPKCKVFMKLAPGFESFRCKKRGGGGGDKSPSRRIYTKMLISTVCTKRN